MASSEPLPRLAPSTHILLTPEPLTPSTFSQFGTAIHSPVPQRLTSVPSSPPEPLHPPHQPRPTSANQRTALKTSPISPLIDTYPEASASNNHAVSKGLMSIFSCFPRRNTYLDPQTGTLRLKLEILERHPFTTQTFCPFNFSSSSSALSSSSTNKIRQDQKKTYFLVIVAPTLHDPSATPSNPPDLSKVRAFLAPTVVDGGLGMAVTYNAGTWHAPMVVLGDRRVDFVVTQFVNGRSADDVQEVLVGEREGKERVVEVDLKGLGIGEGSEAEDGGGNGGLWRAKL